MPPLSLRHDTVNEGGITAGVPLLVLSARLERRNESAQSHSHTPLCFQARKMRPTRDPLVNEFPAPMLWFGEGLRFVDLESHSRILPDLAADSLAGFGRHSPRLHSDQPSRSSVDGREHLTGSPCDGCRQRQGNRVSAATAAHPVAVAPARVVRVRLAVDPAGDLHPPPRSPNTNPQLLEPATSGEPAPCARRYRPTFGTRLSLGPVQPSASPITRLH